MAERKFVNRFLKVDIRDEKGFPTLKFLAVIAVGRLYGGEWYLLENIPEEVREYGSKIHGDFNHRLRMAYNELITQIDIAIWEYIFEIVRVSNFRKYRSFKLSLIKLFPTFVIDKFSINSIIYGFKDRKNPAKRTWILHERAKIPQNILAELNQNYEEYGLTFKFHGLKQFEVKLSNERKFLESDRYRDWIGADDPVNNENICKLTNRLQSCVIC